MGAFAERIGAYALKAVREAKRRSSWTNPDPVYEKALGDFVGSVLDASRPNPFFDAALPFIRRIARLGALNSLAQITLKLCAPGVPDTYQGTELWDLSLVDPDNRRPVDYGERAALVAREDADGIRAEHLLQDWRSGRAKLHILRRLLLCRREDPMLFHEGGYLPLATDPDGEGRIVAFARHRKEALLVVAAPRFIASMPEVGEGWPLGPLWGGGVLVLPEEMQQRRFLNVLTGEPVEADACEDGARLRLSDVFARFPTAVLRAA